MYYYFGRFLQRSYWENEIARIILYFTIQSIDGYLMMGGFVMFIYFVGKEIRKGRKECKK